MAVLQNKAKIVWPQMRRQQRKDARMHAVHRINESRDWLAFKERECAVAILFFTKQADGEFTADMEGKPLDVAARGIRRRGWFVFFFFFFVFVNLLQCSQGAASGVKRVWTRWRK